MHFTIKHYVVRLSQNICVKWHCIYLREIMVTTDSFIDCLSYRISKVKMSVNTQIVLYPSITETILKVGLWPKHRRSFRPRPRPTVATMYSWVNQLFFISSLRSIKTRSITFINKKAKKPSAESLHCSRITISIHKNINFWNERKTREQEMYISSA